MFDEHNAGKFVRVRHRAERKFVWNSLAQGIGKSVGVAADEGDFAGAAVALVNKPFGERIGILLFSAGVEEKRGGCAVRVKAFDGGFGVAHFVYFNRTRVRNAFHVVFKYCAKFGTAYFSER